MHIEQRPPQYYQGYIAGLSTIAFTVLEQLGHQTPLADDLQINIPASNSNLYEMARFDADTYGVDANDQMGQEIYLRSYISGYLFSLHALSAGLLQLLAGLSFAERMMLLLRFALGDEECEPVLQPALHSLRRMHQAYR